MDCRYRDKMADKVVISNFQSKVKNDREHNGDSKLQVTISGIHN